MRGEANDEEKAERSGQGGGRKSGKEGVGEGSRWVGRQSKKDPRKLRR